MSELSSESKAKTQKRLTAIDALRGAVMILMALDHTRDFFHSKAVEFSPTDLTKTSLILFLTRWVTHFCLPVFMFTAGAGAFLWWKRGNRSKRQLARFLWTRGVWFVFLELTVMQFAYNFSFSRSYLILLLILWIFGLCMVLMAALIYLPVGWLLSLSVAVILLHNCLDGVNASSLGAFAGIWLLLHQPGVFPVAGRTVLITYTVLPWIAVMASGFCFGQILTRGQSERQRITFNIGLTLTLAFFLIRGVNVYGDPAKWSWQSSPLYTALSFLNCTKYPASLDFLLMTLGPAFLVLAYFENHPPKPSNPLVVFGRVPLFYFILHFYLIHGILALMSWVRYGANTASFIFHPVPSMGGPRQLFPQGFGYSLPVADTVWIIVVVMLYPCCRWFAKAKAARQRWWMSYL